MNLRDETLFWTRQFSEHLEFLSTMLQGELRDEALGRHAQYAALRRQVQGLDGVAMASAVEPLTRSVHRFQRALCDRLNADEWLGYAWPLFCEHITREVELYLHIAYGDPGPSIGIEAAVSQLGGEHALFAANLIDPSDPGPSKTAREAGWKLIHLARREQSRERIREEIAVQNAIKQFIEKTRLGTQNGVKSLVNFTLREHVLREQDYFMSKLRDGLRP